MATPHILIVEDDMMIAHDLEFIVLDAINATTTVVSSIEGAMARVADDIDFAFLDIDVRDGKTYGLAEHLRERGTLFAFVSGSNPSRLPGCLRDHPFISKPYVPVTIVEALKHTLEGARA